MRLLPRHCSLPRLLSQRHCPAAKVAALILASSVGVALSFGVLYFVVANHVGLD